MHAFIHFNDLSLQSLEVHTYAETKLVSTETVDISSIQLAVAKSSAIYVLVPSQLFGYSVYENAEEFKGEVLKAHVLSEVEDRLISNISSLDFFYDSSKNLASWIDTGIYLKLLNVLNPLDAEIYLFPEHYLIAEHLDRLLVQQDKFLLAYKDGSGFGGLTESLTGYLAMLKDNGYIFNDMDKWSPNAEQSFIATSQANKIPITLDELHNQFLGQQDLKEANYFKRKLSFQFVRSKLKLNFIESTSIAVFASIVLFAPLFINYSLESNADSYNSATIEIFQQLNPSFVRLVNPIAQIDELTKAIPAQDVVTAQNLDAMKYVESLSNDSVQRIEINLMESYINVDLENLPSYKFTIIQEIFKQEPIVINTDRIIEKDSAMYGTLKIIYESK
tara:strand:+ start:3658 stop:4827 length:1170 start_codon:yes stop_codon:yes gene_type:complete